MAAGRAVAEIFRVDALGGLDEASCVALAACLLIR